MRLVVVGTGFAETHLEWIKSSPGLSVEALCYKQDQERAETLAKRFDIPEVSNSISRVIQSSRADAVVVVSPPYTHEEIIGEALAGGLLVVCDKPLSTSLASATRIVKLADSKGLTGFVMFQWRLHPAFQVARNYLANGSLGPIEHLSLSFRHDFLAGPVTASPWRHSHETAGGGALGDMGVHMFDLLRFLRPGTWSVKSGVGLVSRPNRTHAGLAVSCSTEDFADVLLVESEGRCGAAVSVSRIATGLRDIRVTITALKGAIDIALSPDDGRGALTIYSANEQPQTHDFLPGIANPYRAFAAQTTTHSDAEPGLATFQDGLAAQELMEQALAQIAR